MVGLELVVVVVMEVMLLVEPGCGCRLDDGVMGLVVMGLVVMGLD